MNEGAEPQSEISAKMGGHEVSLRGRAAESLNTIVTIAIFVVVCLIAYGLYIHNAETARAATELVSALREQTQALRESNCLSSMQVEQRAANAETCKRLSR